MTDLKDTLHAHLDEALPTVEERRADLARLARPHRRLRGPLLVFAGLTVVVLAGFGWGRAVASGFFQDDRELWVVAALTGADRGVVVEGSRNIFLRSQKARFSDHALPGDFGDRLVPTREVGESGFTLFQNLTWAVKGLNFSMDACVNDKAFDVASGNVPFSVLLDAILDAGGLTATVDGMTVTLRCEGAAEGPLTTLNDTTQWPPESPLLAVNVTLDVDGVPSDVVVAEIARQAGGTVGVDGLATHPLVTMRLKNVRLGTVLSALRESVGVSVYVNDKNQLIVVGPGLPDVRDFPARRARDDARIDALRRDAR